MTAILDAVRRQLGPDTIQQLSGALGADPATTSNAVSLALPALLGGLAHNAARPEGAAALDNALNQHDGSLLDNLGSMLGSGSGAGSGALGGLGGAILGHIFGGRRGPVEEGVGKASGLNAAQVAQLMAMLAPIVMAVLGRMKQSRGLDANRLPEVLNEGGGGLGGGLGSVLGGMFGQKS